MEANSLIMGKAFSLKRAFYLVMFKLVLLFYL